MKIILPALLALLFIIIGSFYFYHHWSLIGDRADQPEYPTEKKTEINPTILLKRELLKKEIEEFFWKNRIQLTEEDNFNLIIYLPDSIFALEIKGIGVHKSHVFKYRLSRSLDLDLAGKQVKNLLKEPLQIQEEWATIDKRPIRVMDISEMRDLEENLSFTPEEKDTLDICIVLKSAHNLSIGLKQIESFNTDSLQLFYQSDLNQTRTNQRDSIVQSRDYEGLMGERWIELYIPANDLIAIFRAIDQESKILVSL